MSETFTRGYSRFQIFIPADGMEEFNNHLKELIEEYDDGETETAAQAPQSRHVRIENKNFFFSCKKNAQGRYITISEVKGNFRNSILIPESGWDDFRDVFDEYTSLLAISNLETDHAGNYSCVATNSVAEYVRSAVLTIRGEFNQSYQKTMMNDQISGKYRYIVYR